jgi:hypothetical protein
MKKGNEVVEVGKAEGRIRDGEREGRGGGVGR